MRKMLVANAAIFGAAGLYVFGILALSYRSSFLSLYQSTPGYADFALTVLVGFEAMFQWSRLVAALAVLFVALLIIGGTPITLANWGVRFLVCVRRFHNHRPWLSWIGKYIGCHILRTNPVFRWHRSNKKKTNFREKDRRLLQRLPWTLYYFSLILVGTSTQRINDQAAANLILSPHSFNPQPLLIEVFVPAATLICLMWIYFRGAWPKALTGAAFGLLVFLEAISFSGYLGFRLARSPADEIDVTAELRGVVLRADPYCSFTPKRAFLLGESSDVYTILTVEDKDRRRSIIWIKKDQLPVMRFIGQEDVFENPIRKQILK